MTPAPPGFRLGGELPLLPEHFLVSETGDPLGHLGQKHHLYLDTGRSAILVALSDTLARGGKKEAWLPRYCCRSLLLPFEQLGFEVKFYSMGSDLASPSGLPASLDGETFVFIHYFGKTNQAIIDYLNMMKHGNSFYIIEDCVQAFFSPPSSLADFSIYSCRKFLPQPDGAILVSRHQLKTTELKPSNEAFVSRRLVGKLIREQDDERALDLFSEANSLIEAICPREISWLSCYLMSRTDVRAVGKQRRANFRHLVSRLRQSGIAPSHLRPLFSTLNEHEVPLGLPVVTSLEIRDHLRDYLKARGVYCAVHWPLAGENKGAEEKELSLSRSLLTLPLDQTLDEDALDYMTAEIERFFREISGIAIRRYS